MATVEIIRKGAEKGTSVCQLVAVPRGQDPWEIAAKAMTSKEVTGVAVHHSPVFRGQASESQPPGES